MSEEITDQALFGHLLMHMIGTVTEGHNGYRQMALRTIPDESVRNVLTSQYCQITGEQWGINAIADENGETRTVYLNINLWTDPTAAGTGPGSGGPVLIREIFTCQTGETNYSIHVQRIPETLREQLIGQPPSKLLEHFTTQILDDAGVTIASIEDFASAVTVHLTPIIEEPS